jgi:hypothetical protein
LLLGGNKMKSLNGYRAHIIHSEKTPGYEVRIVHPQNPSITDFYLASDTEQAMRALKTEVMDAGVSGSFEFTAPLHSDFQTWHDVRAVNLVAVFEFKPE